MRWKSALCAHCRVSCTEVLQRYVRNLRSAVQVATEESLGRLKCCAVEDRARAPPLPRDGACAGGCVRNGGRMDGIKDHETVVRAFANTRRRTWREVAIDRRRPARAQLSDLHLIGVLDRVEFAAGGVSRGTWVAGIFPLRDKGGRGILGRLAEAMRGCVAAPISDPAECYRRKGRIWCAQDPDAMAGRCYLIADEKGVWN